MGKMSRFLLSVVVFLVVSFSSVSFAGEIDILVEKLIAKGILTPVEGQVILEETKQEVTKKIAQGKSYAVPEWVQNTKLKGDLRLRYQWEDPTDAIDRSRERYRLRLGVESKINDNMKVHAGIASGSNDPRSTNETLDDTFETKGAMLDYAYAEWLAAPWATVKAGKIQGVKNCLFTTSDLLWDGDINPEGVSLLLNKKIGNLELFANAGYWILDEWSASAHDPSMYVIQPGFKYKFNGNTHLKAGVACYNFENIVGNSQLEHSSATNTTTGGKLKYSYNSINPNIEFGMKQPLNGLVPYAAIFGEYVVNPDRSEANEGYLCGVKFGAEKVKKLHDWQFKYMYRELEKDAWLDTFPDSDAMGGGTDIKCHELVLAYGLGKNTALGLDYYYGDSIGGVEAHHIFQVDWTLKF
ncbi:MAG: putative porin [bacterium]|nr:putative porin [bacterium]